MPTPTSDPAPSLLAPFAGAPGDAGVVTDFDGTLAPIVDDPAAARPLPGVVEVLHGLARRYGLVAVVSGRPASFLAAQLGLAGDDDELPPLVAAGLYGLETWDAGGVRTHPEAAPWRAVVAGVADGADREAPAGVTVERKNLSVVLHYREAPAAADWCHGWAADAAGRDGLVLHPGRMSVELRPPLDVDKGTVVARLAAGLSAVCFMGDDVGDLPAFAVLDRLAGEGVSTLKVAVRSSEAPPELVERADLVVEGAGGVLELLRRLLDAATGES